MNSRSVGTGLRAPQRYLPQLECLRGWAILLVVLFHYVGILRTGQPSALEHSSVLLQLLAAGNTGVTLFFVLSGFLLVQPFILASSNRTHVNITQFYTARLLRIVPLYYTAVLIAWLVSGNTAALKALLFIPIGFEVFPFSVPWWSLSTEMQFYLILPWIMLGLTHRLGRWLVLAAGLLWIGMHAHYFLQPQWLADQRNAWLQSSIFGRGPAFLVGGLCSWLYLRGSCPWLTGFHLPRSLLGLALLAALLGLLQWYGATGQKSALKAFPLYHTLEAVLWGGLLLCSLRPGKWAQRLFLNPLLSHFGNISYSLYLVHVPVQFYLIYPLMAQTKGALLSQAIAVAIVGSFLLSWALAVVCFRMIEQPFLRLKSRLPVVSDRLPGRPATG